MNMLAKLFGSAPAQQQPMSGPQAQNGAIPAPQTPAQPGNIPAQNLNPASGANPTVPAASVAATQEAPQGLDKFNDMWNLTPEQMPKAPESAFANVTPEAIQNVANNTDFSKVVTPELMQQISAGGEQAAAAMITAMNLVAQQSYAQSAGASMKLIETALEKQRNQFQAELPNLIKSQNVTESLRTSNPIFNHPAATPMLDTLQKQIQLKNPNATAEQIRQQAEEYLVSFASAASPQKTATQAQGNRLAEPDWSSWM